MELSSKSSEERLFQVAHEQQGYFTAIQAINAGFLDANHTYHVKKGNWIRESRGIYRLARYPQAENGHYTLWSLWSQNRIGIRQGVYSHQTALVLFDLSDSMPEKIHMTVPPIFRRHSVLPGVLILHTGRIGKEEIDERDGFAVTRPARTIVDLIMDESVSVDIIQQSYRDANRRGLINEGDFDIYRKNSKIDKKIKDSIPDFK